MKAIMKLCVITMPLVCGSIYSSEPHGVQIPTTQAELDQQVKKIKEINNKEAEKLAKSFATGYIETDQVVPQNIMRKLDQETLTLAQQHNQKLLQDLQRK